MSYHAPLTTKFLPSLLMLIELVVGTVMSLKLKRIVKGVFTLTDMFSYEGISSERPSIAHFCSSVKGFSPKRDQALHFASCVGSSESRFIVFTSSFSGRTCSPSNSYVLLI